MTAIYRASGPGPKTRDGCSVEMYLRLPDFGEAELLRPLLPAGACVLELGCGVGRVTRKLLEAGFAVTAVDNSAEMLEHLPTGARAIHANIEDLALPQRFEAVLLGSCLVNTPDEAMRSRQLAAIRQHLCTGGRLLIERFDPAWLSTVSAGPSGEVGPVSLSVLEARHRGVEVDLCFEYSAGDAAWRQSFTARILDDENFASLLAEAGFSPPTWLTRRWAVTQPRAEAH